jgi:hypothetical protein
MGSGPKEVKELVERFERNLEAYKRQGASGFTAEHAEDAENL